VRVLTDGSPQARLTLGFDVLAIAAFILVGMNSHSDVEAVSTFVRNFVPFTGAWVATALFVHTYRPPSPRTLLVTLAIAIPAGVLLRAVWTGSWTASDVVTFMAVALVFASFFIGIGRVLSATLGTRLFGERS
jgi:dolichyl-phosphate-mannose--protein O-mannosyl transferase